MKKVLITGSNGFVGKALASALLKKDYEVVASVRQKTIDSETRLHEIITGDLSSKIDWTVATSNINVIIHSAARVHILDEKEKDPLTEFRKINVDATLNLATQAFRNGVKRFIYLSSVKVNGEQTEPDHCFSADDTPNPDGPYALSKYEAEKGLREIADEMGKEVVIIRPPLVYGPGVKANFEIMMHWLSRGIPLPLGAIKNQRSLVALDNLVDLILVCIEHPAAANQIFMVSDNDDISTSQLLDILGDALDAKKRLLPVPHNVLKMLAILVGRKDLIIKLCSSLQVDISKTRNLLDWNPPYNAKESLFKTAKEYNLH